MADAIRAESYGIPAVPIALEKLAASTGRAMARAYGAPEFPIGMIYASDHGSQISTLENVTNAQDLEQMATAVAQRVASILRGLPIR